MESASLGISCLLLEEASRSANKSFKLNRLRSHCTGSKQASKGIARVTRKGNSRTLGRLASVALPNSATMKINEIYSRSYRNDLNQKLHEPFRRCIRSSSSELSLVRCILLEEGRILGLGQEVWGSNSWHISQLNIRTSSLMPNTHGSLQHVPSTVLPFIVLSHTLGLCGTLLLPAWTAQAVINSAAMTILR